MAAHADLATHRHFPSRRARRRPELHSINLVAVDDLVPIEDTDPREWFEDLGEPPDLVNLCTRPCLGRLDSASLPMPI